MWSALRNLVNVVRKAKHYKCVNAFLSMKYYKCDPENEISHMCSLALNIINMGRNTKSYKCGPKCEIL